MWGFTPLGTMMKKWWILREEKHQKSFGCGLLGEQKRDESMNGRWWDVFNCLHWSCLFNSLVSTVSFIVAYVMACTVSPWILMMSMLSLGSYLRTYLSVIKDDHGSFVQIEALIRTLVVIGGCSMSMWNYRTVLAVGSSMFSVTSIDHSPYKQLSLSSIRSICIDMESIIMGHV